MLVRFPVFLADARLTNLMSSGINSLFSRRSALKRRPSLLLPWFTTLVHYGIYGSTETLGPLKCVSSIPGHNHDGHLHHKAGNLSQARLSDDMPTPMLPPFPSYLTGMGYVTPPGDS